MTFSDGVEAIKELSTEEKQEIPIAPSAPVSI